MREFESEAKARALLAPPLIFGNEDQIAAIRFLERIDACVDAILKCKHGSKLCDECGGDGEMECPTCYNESECDECGGSGQTRNCSCLDEFTITVLMFATKRIADMPPMRVVIAEQTSI